MMIHITYTHTVREMTFTTSLNEYLQLAMKLDKLLKKPSGSVPLQVLELSRQLAKARQEIGKMEKKKTSTPVKTTTQKENSRTWCSSAKRENFNHVSKCTSLSEVLE